MKRLALTICVAFLFKAIIIAQASFGITVGNNLWINPPQDLSLEYSPKMSFIGPEIGVLSNIAFGEKIALRINLQYAYLVSANDPMGSEYTDDTELIFYESDYHQLRLPVSIAYNATKLKPAIGFFLSYSIAGEERNYYDRGLYNLHLFQAGLTAGVSYAIGKHLQVGATYFLCLNTPVLEFKPAKDNVGETNSSNTGIEPRCHQINIGLSYLF